MVFVPVVQRARRSCHFISTNLAKKYVLVAFAPKMYSSLIKLAVLLLLFFFLSQFFRFMDIRWIFFSRFICVNMIVNLMYGIAVVYKTWYYRESLTFSTQE